MLSNPTYQVMECSKRHKYSRTLCQIGVRESHFVPFIMCASGFMGTAAADWFESILVDPKFRNPMLCWYKLTCHRLATAIGLFDEACHSNLRAFASSS